MLGYPTGATNVHVSPALATRVNVEGTLNLLQALDGNYRVFVNTGTCHEYGDNQPPFREDQDPRPKLPYAITKTAVWHFCRRLHTTKGWPIVNVRPFAVYGPRQPDRAFIPACIRAAQRGIDFGMTGGEQQRDLIYVSDVVEGFIRAATVSEAGVFRGFTSLYRRGKVSRLPRMVAGSSPYKNPIVCSYLRRNERCEDLAPQRIRENAVNEPLINWHSIDGQQTLDAIRETHGWAAHASDRAMISLTRTLRDQEGISVLPASTPIL